MGRDSGSRSTQHFHTLDEAKRYLTRLKQSGGAWVTIGSFDGIHRGHQAILAPMVSGAHATGVPAVMITFHPHPVVVLRGNSEPIYLNSPEERAHLAGKLGVDIVVTLEFNRALANLTAEEFISQLKSALGMSTLWVGDDFALGRNRQGDLPVLRQLGEKYGYSLRVVEKVTGNGPDERVSSSRIRELLRDGQVASAAQLLGRPYAIEGPVVQGDGRGRGLGFPTLNVSYWSSKIIPLYGVYATWTWVGERRLPSVTSVGVRPTFVDVPTAPRIEAFLIDHAENLYGTVVKVEFLELLRPELKFDSAKALIDQMILDTQNAREVLAHAD